MLPPSLNYLAPTTLASAVQALASHPRAAYTAGSYRLLIDLKMQRLNLDTLVDLQRIRELYALETTPTGLEIGAMVSLSQLANHPRIPALLSQAAAHTGDAQIRNMAGLGGTLAYEASSSEIASALLALKAVVHTRHSGGSRQLPITHFLAITGGSALRHDEVVVGIGIPTPHGEAAFAHHAHPASLRATIALAVQVERNPRGEVTQAALAVSGSLGQARRLEAAEQALLGQTLSAIAIGKAARMATLGLNWAPSHESPEYRSHRLGVMLGRALSAIA
jgi:CO/xanthine dehydrogenase FAD-binding subunit